MLLVTMWVGEGMVSSLGAYLPTLSLTPLVLAFHPVDLHALEAMVAILLFASLFSVISVLYLLWRVDRHGEQLKDLQKRNSWGVDETLNAMGRASKSYLGQFLERD